MEEDMDMRYIHQLDSWPKFVWDQKQIAALLGPVRHSQGRLMGRMEAMGFSLRAEAVLQTLTLDIVKSSEIEGVVLDSRRVRSSIARRLGMDIAGLVSSDRNVDGVVEMMLDATQGFNKPLTKKRLFAWHAALFPAEHSGLRKIRAGAWRDDRRGPMQVVSGPAGKERVHFEAPQAFRLNGEMKTFFEWFERRDETDPVLRAGIAHLWFVTIHPFDDGNGRIARAITDMQLARADNSSERFYSMSVQIRQERAAYYDVLERAQKITIGDTNEDRTRQGIDITGWLKWYLDCLSRALVSTETTLAAVFRKARFWQVHPEKTMNDRQQSMINRLLDGFEGKLTSSKWAKIAKCSQDTALRDIFDLVKKGVLNKETAGGRSTSYLLSVD